MPLLHSRISARPDASRLKSLLLRAFGTFLYIEQEVGEESSSAFYCASYAYRNRSSEYRPIVDEGVKLSILAARISSRRKRSKKFFVVKSADESSSNRCFDARKVSLETESDYFAGEFGRVAFPDWKEAAHPSRREIRFAPRTQIFEKQIAKGDRSHSVATVFEHHIFHDRLVDLVRASGGGT